MDDHTPGLESASEGAEDLELEPQVETPKGEEPKEPGSDPLDDIQDPEARAQAKKDRAIARRRANDAESKPESTPAPEPTKEFLTKEDFYKSNEKKAIREATADPEVKAQWAKIVPFYTPRRGKETPEDVLEDIKDAITLYKARNPEVAKDDSADALIVTAAAKPGGGTIDKTPAKVANPPNFRLPTKPQDWYGKPKA